MSSHRKVWFETKRGELTRMLKSISIDNYALIEKLEMDLEKGLSIITGETGAGKSILLGALGLLLGKRADTSVLKDAQRKCIVEGTFGIKGYGLEDFFRENEIDYYEETIIRREIASSGKSRAFINDTPVNLPLLQDLTLSLIDIHSQHQSLSLNSDSYMRWIIDAFAGLNAELHEYQQAYQHFITSRRKYQESLSGYQQDKENLEFLTHQFNELNAAGLKPGELAELEELSSVLGNADEIRSALEGSLQLLSEENTGVVPGLKQVLDLLQRIRKHYPSSDELAQRTESAYIELKDIQSEILHHSEKVEIDPLRLEQINQRIDLLNTLMHKYKVDGVEELINLRDKFDRKLQEVALSDSALESLAEELGKSEKKVTDWARILSEKRKAVLGSFEKQILTLLQELGMKHAAFEIRQEKAELGPYGTDRIQFFFSANSNIPAQNIARVASGGELSRLMLTIKYLISGASGLPTIIFDEIDTGVSGEIADKVGRLIKEMARSMQVINITHLPQVASKGDHHFIVYKELQNNTTKTLLRKLNDDDRLQEIARMLSGDSVTDAAIENARVLLGQ